MVIKPKRKKSKYLYVYLAYQIVDTVEGYGLWFPESFYRVYAEEMIQEARKLLDYTLRLKQPWSKDIESVKYRMVYASRAVSTIDSLEKAMERCFTRFRQTLPMMYDYTTGKLLSRSKICRKTEVAINRLASLLSKERIRLTNISTGMRHQLEKAGVFDSFHQEEIEDLLVEYNCLDETFDDPDGEEH